MTNPLDVTFTFQDWLQIPEDGFRHEVLAGDHVVTPSPNLVHQRISRQLLLQFAALIADRGEVLYAPLGVRLSDQNVVEPDLIVVLAENSSILKETHVDGPPDLVVEILSKSTGPRDRGIKKNQYEAFGVREYWIVDPLGRIVEQYVLEAGKYRLVGRHAEKICLQILSDVAIDLKKVW